MLFRFTIFREKIILIIGEQRWSLLGISREGLGWKLVCTASRKKVRVFFWGGAQAVCSRVVKSLTDQELVGVSEGQVRLSIVLLPRWT